MSRRRAHPLAPARGRWLGAALAALAAALATPTAGCTSPEGVGTARGGLDFPPCWQGPFDLAPDFFGTAPYRDSAIFRLQRSSDNQTFSDGISLVVEDLTRVQRALGSPFLVTLPPEVTAAGVPIKPEADPGIVHMSLYLQKSCKTQTTTLHAVREVTFAPDTAAGGCEAADEGQDPACANPVPGPRGDGKSRIVFHSIFAGDTATLDSEARRTRGCFDVYLANPREIDPVTLAPPRCRGRLRGTFDFLYRRSRPSQQFP
jgi:hypothetical protein